MPTAEQVRDLTMDTIGTARDRATDLARDIELPSVDVDDLVDQAVSHKLRTTLILTLLVLIIAVAVRKLIASGDEPIPDSSS